MHSRVVFNITVLLVDSYRPQLKDKLMNTCNVSWENQIPSLCKASKFQNWQQLSKVAV